MSALTILSTVFQLIPALITAIKAIEDAIPGQGQGEKKLAAVRQIVEGAYDQASVLWPYLEKTVAALVGLFNITGVFKRS